LQAKQRKKSGKGWGNVMKILLANYDLEKRSGSEMWTLTMFNYLSRFHEVDVFVPPSGFNAMIGSWADREQEYDLALVNHNICLEELAEWDIKRRIFTSHGPIPELEQPIPGADVYVAVSEEVHANLTSKGFFSHVIRNPIDTNYFTPAPVNPELRNILWMNNRAPNIELIEKVSQGFEYRIQTGWADGVKENIQWADLVMTSGRGIYEALSCGKNVMVVNWCGVDGMVTRENIEKLRTVNCSGRYYNQFWGPDRMREEFKRYDPERDMRAYVIENHEVSTIAGRYLKL
jgi:glycosyltransferase involved in cell wall biosynthesis